MTDEAAARAFGLVLGHTGRVARLTRLDVHVDFDAALPSATTADRHASTVVFHGVRLGVDRLRFDEAGSRLSGELKLLLVHNTVVDVASRVAGVRPVSMPWLAGVPYSTLLTHETGKLRVFATPADLVDRPDPWDSARRASFYDAYQLRPAETPTVGDGRLHVFRTTAGLAATVGTLMPDFDFDAARDHGAFAIVDSDVLAVYRPAHAPVQWGPVRSAIRSLAQAAQRPFSRRLYHLRPTGILVGEVCGAQAEFHAANLVQKLIRVTT